MYLVLSTSDSSASDLQHGPMLCLVITVITVCAYCMISTFKDVPNTCITTSVENSRGGADMYLE